MRFSSVLFWLVLLAFFVQPDSVLFGQDVAETESKPKAELVDEFGKLGDCDLSGRLDALLATLSERPDHQGYIINYEGADTLPGDRQKFFRERTLANQIGFRNFDRSRITFVRGGFRPRLMTELWLVPPGADFPEPSQTVPEPKIPVNQTFLFAVSNFWGEEIADPLEEFILPSVKEAEEAERLAQIAEREKEAEGTDEVVDQSNELDSEEIETPSEEFVDERTPEEREEERFRWANVGIARLLTERKIGTGVIIFYADDQRYDITKLESFILQGRNLLAEHGPIKTQRLRVQFGGYRHHPEVEFWVVPPKGKRPIPTPVERSIKEAGSEN